MIGSAMASVSVMVRAAVSARDRVGPVLGMAEKKHIKNGQERPYSEA